MEEKKKDYIDLRILVKLLWANRKKFYVVLPITFVLSCAYVLCLPRYYSTAVKLVPEVENSSVAGSLGDLASSFGIDLSNIQSTDAISPLLYPDLMDDNGFVAKLFQIKVKSDFHEDMPVDTTYYAYMRWFQRKTPWGPIFDSILKLFAEKPQKNSGSSEYDPYNVSKMDFELMEKVRDNISFNIDKKTAVVTLSVIAQDPYICRQLADSVRECLQDFITDYRTHKARVDMDYYQKLSDEAYREYMEAVNKYTQAVDTHNDVIRQRIRSEIDNLEKEMELKYNAYQTTTMQLQAAKAKVQERTPAFTVLMGASVPVKPTGPKRMLIVIGLCFVAFIGTVIWCIKDDPNGLSI